MNQPKVSQPKQNQAKRNETKSYQIIQLLTTTHNAKPESTKNENISNHEGDFSDFAKYLHCQL